MRVGSTSCSWWLHSIGHGRAILTGFRSARTIVEWSGVSVPTGLAGVVPMGVQLIGPRFREDLMLDAAEVIESRCPPMTPFDPR